ncbi:MAG: nicotinamide-nucleotide amidohydrolase family protein, partial [Deltaproteobacteria bacterium]|nr:nicotinamide-nucleotide amidohydrolase family protein [Deltaproteobacteria bacterium]
CRGEIIDTNRSWLAARLWDLGITTRWMTSCNDDEADIAEAMSRAVLRADLVICSGGLGPTEDDLTVDVTSKLLGVEPVVDEPAKQRWEARFKGLIQMNELQLRQLRVPRGARVHPNPAGAAPCFETELSGVPLFCLPGFPREIHGIYEGGFGARLEELRASRGDGEQIARRIFRVFGRGESQISQACRGLIDDTPNTTIHYQVKFPEVLVKLVVRDRDSRVATARLEALDREMRSRLAPYLYTVGEENLVDRTVRRAMTSRTKLATAESCTGGMIGELITAMPGSSSAYLGGAIVYSNAEKVRQLGVSQATLDEHGAVSEQTVVEMARGACERFGVDLAVSVSGIAGPDGGTPDKPVGTVWVALAGSPAFVGSCCARGQGVELADPKTGILGTRRLSWPGARDQIRILSSWWSLAMIDAALDLVSADDLTRATWVLRGGK